VTHAHRSQLWLTTRARAHTGRMTWSKVSVVLGLLLLASGFYLATDTPISTKVDGQLYHCADVLGPDSLVSGLPDTQEASPDGRTPEERRLDVRIAAACSTLERGAQWAVWGGIGLGGLALLTGWTALREREHDEQIAARSAP